MEGNQVKMAARLMLYKADTQRKKAGAKVENEGITMGTSLPGKWAYYKQLNMPISGSKTLMTSGV